MKVGNRNRRFGWIWLTLGMILGAIIEFRLVIDQAGFGKNFAGNEGIAQMRQFWRFSHVHINVLAIMNLLYALYIDKAVLSERAKNWGSWLAIIGAIVLPGAIFLGSFAIPFAALAPLGGLMLIAALIIIAVGHWRVREMQ